VLRDFLIGFPVDFTAELDRSEIRRELVFRDTAVGRKPPSRQRRVAPATVDVDFLIAAFSVPVDDVLAVEILFVLYWVVGLKSIRIDGQDSSLWSTSRSKTVDSLADFTGTTYRSFVPRSTSVNTGGLSPPCGPRLRVDSPRERDSSSRLRPLSPAETHTSSISTRPDSVSEGAGCALAMRSTSRRSDR